MHPNPHTIAHTIARALAAHGYVRLTPGARWYGGLQLRILADEVSECLGGAPVRVTVEEGDDLLLVVDRGGSTPPA